MGKSERIGRLLLAVGSVGLVLAGGCGHDREGGGQVAVDGSSTVYPITEAVAEEFGRVHPAVRVQVGISGTGGGFKRFVAGEIDISNASRPIKPAELEAARVNDVQFIELPVAYDGISFLVHKDNNWVRDITIAELKKIYLESQAVGRWSEVRTGYPDQPIRIYAPGTDSGTFDYFKEVVAADGRAIRSDMSVSEDDNVLVRGVAGDVNAIGFMGFAYYHENRERLRAVAVLDAGGRAVLPTPETIESGEYAPFSRPLFIYVSAHSAERSEVDAFVRFYLEQAPGLATEVGYVPLPGEIYGRALRRYEGRKTGTLFLDEQMRPVTGALSEVYR